MRFVRDTNAVVAALRSARGASAAVLRRNVLVARAERIETSYRLRPQLRDAGDELVLETAANGRAEALVKFNEPDFVAAAPRFGLD